MILAKIIVYIVFYLSFFAVTSIFIAVDIFILKKSIKLIRSVFNEQIHRLSEKKGNV